MAKEQQNFAWASLSKKARSSIKRAYFYPALNEDYNRGFNEAIEEILGKDNLTSDTEPEEMLMVERRKVQKLYESIHDDYLAADESLPYFLAQNAESLLKTLFDDKCLPDKAEEIADKCIESVKEHLNTEENKETISDTISSPLDVLDEFTPTTYITEKPIEEKELNLCELLKGCVGQCFYAIPYGEMELKEINKLELKPLHFSKGTINCLVKTDGRAYEDGSCIIYPSRALYEKFPFDAYSAWMEWKEARKPKRWRAKNAGQYWRIIFDESHDGYITNSADVRDTIDNANYSIGNYFRTKEEAKQAVEAVRETLAKLYEKSNR